MFLTFSTSVQGKVRYEFICAKHNLQVLLILWMLYPITVRSLFKLRSSCILNTSLFKCIRQFNKENNNME